MKDEIKIVLLTSFVMTKSKWFAEEMNYLEKESNIEIHELCDFLYPIARKMLHETHKNERIFTFNKFSSWKKHILELHQKCIKDGKKLIILSELSKYPLHGLNLKYVIVYNFLKKNLIDYYEFNNAGIKSPKATTGTYLKYFKVFRYWRYVIMRLNELFTSFFGNLLNLKPKGIFVAGNQAKKKLEYFKKTKGIELIDFNTWEFSSTINQRNNDKNSLEKKYAVFINMTNPKKKTDEKMVNLKSTETFEKWYPALNNFFSNLEKIFNLKIIIASHPKSNEEGSLDYLGNRVAILNKTEELIKGSEFVVGRNSTALAFAIIYKKPIFFIYSNETKKNTPTFNSINTFSDYFKTKSINIDEKFNENEIKSLKNFDKKLYDNYTNDFLSSNSKDKNYKIILKHLNN